MPFLSILSSVLGWPRPARPLGPLPQRTQAPLPPVPQTQTGPVMPAGYQRVLKTSSLELVDPDTGKTVGLLGVVPGRGAALQFKTNDGFTTIKMGPTPEGTSQIRMYNPITGQPAWMLQVATAPGALGYSALNTFYNPDGKPVVQIGTRENGRGYVATDNRDGQLVTHTAPRLRLYG